MRKIYLFCTFGMSTSMLAKKMQSVANDNKLPISVEAYNINVIDSIVSKEKPDCVMLGPQIKHQADNIINRISNISPETKVEVINAEDYGKMAGDKILRRAVDLIKRNK